LGRAKLAGLLVERTENKNLTATVTPADQVPDLATMWAKVAVKAKPEPETYPIVHQPHSRHLGGLPTELSVSG
jgi:hypothetical protein